MWARLARVGPRRTKVFAWRGASCGVGAAGQRVVTMAPHGEVAEWLKAAPC